jgi:hypothetical protein
MRVIVWLLVIAFAVTVAGCKQPPQTAVATSVPTTTAAAPKPPAAPPKAPVPPRRVAAAGYEQLVLTVSIPAQSEAAPGEAPAAPGGHPGCPKSASSDILGIQISQPHGVIVGAVVPGGPADMAGIKVGDSIIACDGQPVTCPASLLPLLSGGGPRELTLTIRRPKAAAAAPAPPAGHAGA